MPPEVGWAILFILVVDSRRVVATAGCYATVYFMRCSCLNAFHLLQIYCDLVLKVMVNSFMNN